MTSIKKLQIGENEFDFNKLQSDNAVVEVVGDTINNFANKLQFGRHVDDSNSENLLVVGNGSGADSTSNALELTYNGELKAQTEVQVGEHRLTKKLDKNDLPSASKGISLCNNDSVINIGEIESNGEVVLVNDYIDYKEYNDLIIRFPSSIYDFSKIHLKNDYSRGAFDLDEDFDIKDLYVGKILSEREIKAGPYTTLWSCIKIKNIDTDSINIVASGSIGCGICLRQILITPIPKKQFQLSLSGKTDNKPFGYNPAKDDWQIISSEAVKEVNELPEEKENVIYNLKEISQIGKTYEQNIITSSPNGYIRSISNFEVDVWELGKGTFILEVIDNITQEKKVFYKNNEISFSNNQFSVSDDNISYTISFELSNLSNYIQRLTIVVIPKDNVERDCTYKLSLFDYAKPIVYAKDVQLLTADAITIASDDDINDILTNVFTYLYFNDNTSKKEDIIGKYKLDVSYKENLIKVILAEKITMLDNSSFRDCLNLKEVKLSKNLISIGNSCFENCNQLTSIIIPDSVTSINERAFYYCSSLKKINIPNGLTVINMGLLMGTAIEKIDLPIGITKIGSGAFANCENLTSIVIPNGVTEIGENGFGYCINLSDITLPDTLLKISSRTFNMLPKIGILRCKQDWYENLDSTFITNLRNIVNWEKIWI